MASWDERQADQEEDSFVHPPRSQKYAIPRAPDPSSICPDTESNVESQTEDVFKNFMYQSYRQCQIRQQYDSSPRIQEFVDMNLQDQISPTAQIGRHLARIGDEINDRYGDEFDGMLRSLQVNKDNAYDAFASVARKMIENSLSWGRVIALMSFGFRMGMSVLANSTGRVSEFLRMIISVVTKFFLQEKVTKWIAENGGWRAALTYLPTLSNTTFGIISALALVSVAAVVYYKTSQ